MLGGGEHVPYDVLSIMALVCKIYHVDGRVNGSTSVGVPVDCGRPYSSLLQAEEE